MFTNKSTNYLSILLLDKSKPDYSFKLVEFDKRVVIDEEGSDNVLGKVQIFNTDRLPGESTKACRFFSIWGYCNGLFCLLKLEFGLYNLFVINPILGEFIQLPQPVEYPTDKMVFFAYGLGYCELTNRYKVLRIIIEYLRGCTYKSKTEIFTIGYDHSWRSVLNVEVPYNIKWGYQNPNPQSPMVWLRSALHWIVQPTMIAGRNVLKPSWGARICICAFDITQEKVTALSLPPELAAYYPFPGVLSVLLDKLCVLQKRILPDTIEFWVMDEYGVEGSWKKHCVVDMSMLPRGILSGLLMPLTVSPEGLILLTDYFTFFSCDMKKQKCLRVIHQSKQSLCPIPFVPSFVSLRYIVQGPGLMMDVQHRLITR